MRLSPKSIFIGLVALGLPISVAIGWTLATPTRDPSAIGAPGGTGVLGDAAGNGAVGAAPERAPARPVTTVKLPVRPTPTAAVVLPPATAPSAAPTATTGPPVTPTTAPSTLPPLPPLNEPPVPTPTEIAVPTGSASASASADPSAAAG